MPLIRSPNLEGAVGGADPLCIICNDSLESRDKISTSCKHEFHTNCLRKWLDSNPTCPICRQPCARDSIPAQNEPSMSRDRSGTVIRERPNTRLYAQQQILTLPEPIPPHSPTSARRVTGSNIDPIAELRVRNIITETLNSFRTEFTAEMQNMMRNLNINMNQHNPSNGVPNTTASWSEDEPLVEERPFRAPNFDQRNIPFPISNRNENSAVVSERVSNVIHNWHLKFSGSREGIPIDEFIYRINTLTTIYLNGNFDLLCRHVDSRFEGRALQWFWRYHRREDRVEWFELCEALRSQYKEAMSDYDKKRRHEASEAKE